MRVVYRSSTEACSARGQARASARSPSATSVIPPRDITDMRQISRGDGVGKEPVSWLVGWWVGGMTAVSWLVGSWVGEKRPQEADASRGRSTHELTLQPTNSPRSHDLTLQPTHSPLPHAFST